MLIAADYRGYAIYRIIGGVSAFRIVADMRHLTILSKPDRDGCAAQLADGPKLPCRLMTVGNFIDQALWDGMHTGAHRTFAVWMSGPGGLLRRQSEKTEGDNVASPLYHALLMPSFPSAFAEQNRCISPWHDSIHEFSALLAQSKDLVIRARFAPPVGRACGLCGRWFLLVLPPGEEETERDRLCPNCLRLSPPPEPHP